MSVKKYLICCLLGWALGWAGMAAAGQPASSEASLFYILFWDKAAPHEKVAVILPGHGRKITEPAYQDIAAAYRERGISPVLVAVDWSRVGPRELGQAADQISAGVLTSFPGAQVYLFGFSFGAVIAFELSRSLHPAQVMLCSMSPVFAEDLENQNFPFRQLGGIFWGSHSPTYARPPDCGFTFMYGDRDSFLLNPAILACRQKAFSESRTRVVKNARHQLDAHYLDAIRQQVSEMP